MSDKNEQLFTEAVQERRQAMWRVAYSLLHSDADAEDAVSNAVESTWKHLPRIRTKEALPAYLMRSVINAAHDELRKRKRTTSIEPLKNVLEAPPAERGIADYVTGLEEKYRLPLLLKFDEEMQEKEIAAALRIPRGTVSSRIARGLEMIRKEMKKEEVQDVSGRNENSPSGKSADTACGL
jgi:RNA polymerase sigma-70 factor (ECF subfamily)